MKKIKYKGGVGSTWFTNGKVYEVQNGFVIDDEGDANDTWDGMDFDEVTTTGASKNDTADKKLKYRFVHSTLIDECTKSMMAGEIKYGAYNYLKGHSINQLMDAAIRHLKQYQEGENIDKDTTALLGMNVRHLGCALANINMLLIQEKHDTLIDDRPIIEGVIQDEEII